MMTLRQKIFFSALMISLTSLTYARESVIPLDGGRVRMNEIIAISLDRLVANVRYNVMCTVISTNESSQGFNDIRVYASSGHPQFRVNGKLLEAHGQINIPTDSPNVLIVSELYKDSNYIFIQNLDQTDTIIVDNCLAEPARS